MTPSIHLNGYRAYVEAFGDGSPIVLVHGLAGSVDTTWEAVADDLAADHCVVAYDLRGAGRSAVPAGPYTLELLVADLAALLAMIDEQAVLVGHSLGGAIALATAAQAPERVSRVVAVGVALELPKPGREMVLGIASRAEAEGMRAVADTLAVLGTSERFRAEHPDRFGAFVAAVSAANARGFAALARAVAGIELTSHLPRVVAPVTLVAATEDGLSPLAANQQVAHMLPDAHLQVLLDSGHEMTLEQPDGLVQLIRRSLASTDQQSGARGVRRAL